MATARVDARGLSRFVNGAVPGLPASEYYDPASKRLSDYQRVIQELEFSKGLELPRGGGFRVGQGSPVVSTAPPVAVGTPFPPDPGTLPAVRTAAGAPDTSRFARGFNLGAQGETVSAGRPAAGVPTTTTGTSLVDPTPTPRRVRASVPAVRGAGGLRPITKLGPTTIAFDEQGGIAGRTAAAINSAVQRDFAQVPTPAAPAEDAGSIYGRDTGFDQIVRKIKGFVGNNNTISGSKAPTYVADPYSVDTVTATSPVLKRSTPDVVLNTPTPPMTSDQMLAQTQLPRGFGQQRAQDVVTTTSGPDTPVMSLAENAALTAEREAFATNKKASEEKAADAKYLTDRIRMLNDVIRANVGNQYDGPERIAAAQAELATITGQQDKALKADEIASGVQKEGIRGGFDLQRQALANQGALGVAAAKAEGDAVDNEYKRGMLRVAEANSANTIKNSLSKEEQIAQSAAARKEAAAAKEEADMLATAAKTDDPATALANMREMKTNPRGFVVRSNLKKYVEANDKVGKLQRKLSDTDMVKSLTRAGYSDDEIAQALNMRQK